MNDFFNPYPYGQQQFYQTQMRQPVMQNQMQQNADDRIFVPNEQAANAYMVVPGGFVRLWDSQKPVFYEKQAGTDGRQFPMTIYEYKVKQGQETQEAQQRYATKEELEEIRKRLDALTGGKQNE